MTAIELRTIFRHYEMYRIYKEKNFQQPQSLIDWFNERNN